MQHVYSKRSNRQSWPIKALAIAVVIGLTGTVTQAATVNRKPIGDLEIYAPAKPGTATIFMMLDTSGSMGDGFIDDDYGNSFRNCRTSSVSSEKINAVIYKRKLDPSAEDGLLRDVDGNTVKDFQNKYATISFTPSGCTVNRVTRYSRLVRLQIALIELLADDVVFIANAIDFTSLLKTIFTINLWISISKVRLTCD